VGTHPPWGEGGSRRRNEDNREAWCRSSRPSGPFPFRTLQLSLRDNADPSQKIEHLTIRLYGALILAQVHERLGAHLACAAPHAGCPHPRAVAPLSHASPQAWITHVARQSHDAVMRRGLVQAYWGTFSLTTLALLRAQVTPGGGMSALNWINILAFLLLSLAYAYFAFFEKVGAPGTPSWEPIDWGRRNGDVGLNLVGRATALLSVSPKPSRRYELLRALAR
jgi:hypothetical protein